MQVTRAQIDALLKGFSGPVRKAIEQAIRSAQGRANILLMEKAIKAGDIEGLLRAAGIRDSMWAGVTEQLRAAYTAGGAFALAADLPKKFKFDFDLNNPRAEAWLRKQSSQLITGKLKVEQRAAVQTILQNGMMQGANPRTTALDIVGRISKETGRRQGGVLGLTNQQTNYVINASDDLANLDTRYFARTLRDKRFDSIVRRAIKDGTPLPRDVRNKIIARYEDRMLKHRADTIARTETLAAVNEASDEALRQIVGEGLAPNNSVKRIWRHSFSINEREGHRLMSGQERDIDDYFTNPLTGAVLKHPGDGPASEVINCRCYLEHKIDFFAVENARAA